MEYETVPVGDIQSFRESNIEQRRSVECFCVVLGDDKDSVVNVLPHEKWMNVVDKYPEMMLTVAERNDDCYIVFWITDGWEELPTCFHFGQIFFNIRPVPFIMNNFYPA